MRIHSVEHIPVYSASRITFPFRNILETTTPSRFNPHINVHDYYIHFDIYIIAQLTLISFDKFSIKENYTSVKKKT